MYTLIVNVQRTKHTGRDIQAYWIKVYVFAHSYALTQKFSKYETGLPSGAQEVRK